MAQTAVDLVKRLILRLPAQDIPKLLNMWGVLSETQLQKINFVQTKEMVAQQICDICEERHITNKDAADLEIIYNYTHSDRRSWNVYQMTRQQDGEVDLFDAKDFKCQFKEHLQSYGKNNVMVSFKDFDEAIWIRIAWSAHYSKVNQKNSTYVVYHSQTPYVFISNLTKTHRSLLCQAFLVAAKYTEIKELELRSRFLDSLEDIVFKQYSQAYQTYQPKPLQERNIVPNAVVDPRIIRENAKDKERIRKIVLEKFGDGAPPKLEFAQYKLETAFIDDSGRGILADRRELPFQCVVKFTSPNLLEAFKSTALLEISDVPPSPLLTCIPQRARNYFRITGKKGLRPGTPGL